MASGPEVFSVWGYVIANAVDSTVELNPRLLAAVIGSTPERMMAAIETLCAADPHSRSPECDGRRLIQEGPYQYRVVNHAKYRSIRNEEERREYNRIKKQEERARKSNDVKRDVNDSQRMSSVSAHTEAEAEAEKIEPTALVVSSPKLPACPVDEIIGIYHEVLPVLPRVDVVNAGRKRSLAARWREVAAEHKDSPDVRSACIDWFRWYFSKAGESKFLVGKVKDWRADFDFLISPSKFAKVVEGHYSKERA